MITAILQARMGSTRLPGKMALPIADGKGALELMLERISRAQTLQNIIVATTVLPEDDVLVDLCDRIGVRSFRGSPTDVLDRYFQCAGAIEEKGVLVRLTGDCPLHDATVIDRVVNYFLSGAFDYVSNTHPPTFPDGLDTEVFTYAALARAHAAATLPSEREHVTYYMYTHPSEFRLGNVLHDVDLSTHRWTLDEPADLAFIRSIFAQLEPLGPLFGMADVLTLLEKQPDLRSLNANIERNAGLQKSLRLDGQPRKNR